MRDAMTNWLIGKTEAGSEMWGNVVVEPEVPGVEQTAKLNSLL